MAPTFSILFVTYCTSISGTLLNIRRNIVSYVLNEWDRFKVWTDDCTGDNYTTQEHYKSEMLKPFTYASALSMFLNTLTPKFYVALTGTSSLISGLILIFEWWYFRKYGTSFIEQVSVSHLRPLLGGVDNSSPSNSSTTNGDSDSSRQSVSVMQKAWRERNPQARISAAHEALELNDCATAYILLAEEEATTIVEAEKLFKQALKVGEGCYRRSQQLQHHGAQYEAQHSKKLLT
ncbi:ST7 protein, partial [Polypterus senegalus]